MATFLNILAMEQKVGLAQKLGTMNAQRLRMVEGTVLRSLPLPVDSECFKAQHAVKQNYTEKTKGKKGHGMGPPDP